MANLVTELEAVLATLPCDPDELAALLRKVIDRHGHSAIPVRVIGNKVCVDAPDGSQEIDPRIAGGGWASAVVLGDAIAPNPYLQLQDAVERSAMRRTS